MPDAQGNTSREGSHRPSLTHIPQSAKMRISTKIKQVMMLYDMKFSMENSEEITLFMVHKTKSEEKEYTGKWSEVINSAHKQFKKELNGKTF